ncbi:unnamed protein product [Adineta ricciae]|uniref:YrhK domain-containing protein n=1 Tax=Adineta ricciae TaxID=249248 RepID=A0A814VN27_ADIRI|nr:unnamed protein product [Adineta ricciae]CAF1483491.1 unnamed protein product [Adineta ricciae]
MSKTVNEKDVPAEVSHTNLLDYPHSIIWRILHGTSFLFGGLLFICGSCMYFTDVIANNDRALEAGGWLYTVGSACFLLADIQDWLYYHIGFLFSSSKVNDSQSKPMFRNRLRRVAINVNYFTSNVGSALYLVGSVFFLPKFADSILVGDGLFIAGSAVIYLSEGWKIVRLARTSAENANDTSFRFQNIKTNIQAIFISFFAGLGGFFYFVGTILFLPQYTTTDFGENRAAGLFLCGGIFFTLAGLLLQYCYYCKSRK